MLLPLHERHDGSVRLALDLPDTSHHMFRGQWNCLLLHPGPERQRRVGPRSFQLETLQEAVFRPLRRMVVLLHAWLYNPRLLHRRLLPIRGFVCI